MVFEGRGEAFSYQVMMVLDARLSVGPSGIGVREPNFIRQLTQWCEAQPVAKGLDPKVERRECYRAGILFCRRHHRMDSFCLLVFVQHYLSAKLLIAFDGKIGL